MCCWCTCRWWCCGEGEGHDYDAYVHLIEYIGDLRISLHVIAISAVLVSHPVFIISVYSLFMLYVLLLRWIVISRSYASYAYGHIEFQFLDVSMNEK